MINDAFIGLEYSFRVFDSSELNISLANSNQRRETPQIVFGLSRLFYVCSLFLVLSLTPTLIPRDERSVCVPTYAFYYCTRFLLAYLYTPTKRGFTFLAPLPISMHTCFPVLISSMRIRG